MESLTNREREVLSYVVKGWSNEEIAKKLFISKHTVKMHISIILQKMSVRNRCEAAFILGKDHIL